MASNGAIFNKGNKTNGNNATTGIGNASVTHKQIITAANANILFAAGSTWKGFTAYMINAIATLMQIHKSDFGKFLKEQV